MMNFALKYILPLLLITVLCIVGVQAFYRLVEQRMDTVETEPKVSSRVPVAAEKPAVAKDGQVNADSSIITRRNLFASKGDAVAKEESIDPLAAAEPTKLGFVLMGTAIDADNDNRAFIYDKRKRRQDMYREGDSLQGALIRQIRYGKVIISVNGKNELLDIVEARKIKVPQVRKPAPVTSTRQVGGQPVKGASSVKLPSGAAAVNPKTRRVPQAGSARQIRAYRTDLPRKAPPAAEEVDTGVTEGAGQ